MGKIGEGCYRLPVMKSVSHRDVTYGIGNAVSNAVITWHGDRWYLDLAQGSFCNVYEYQITMMST